MNMATSKAGKFVFTTQIASANATKNEQKTDSVWFGCALSPAARFALEVASRWQTRFSLVALKLT
jgi:hypothetical protein